MQEGVGVAEFREEVDAAFAVVEAATENDSTDDWAAAIRLIAAGAGFSGACVARCPGRLEALPGSVERIAITEEGPQFFLAGTECVLAENWEGEVVGACPPEKVEGLERSTRIRGAKEAVGIAEEAVERVDDERQVVGCAIFKNGAYRIATGFVI